MKYVSGVNRKQVILFPEVIDEYISEDNPVRFIDAFVDSLDLKELGFKHAELEDTGRPPYNPADLLKLYIYGYLNRIRTSRLLERECNRNVEVMWLLKKLAPDFKTIADFRKDNSEALKKVFKEFVFLCRELELFGRELITIDGSKFKAVNAKMKNFNETKLIRKLKEIDEKIDMYFKELEENDQKDTEEKPIDEERLKVKIAQLEERMKEYDGLLKKLRESGEIQISLTDPDSRAMLNNQKIDICYNVQTSVDSKHKLIFDFEATNETTDNNQLSKMAKRAKEILEKDRLEVLCDKGYYDLEEVKECVDNGIIPYIPEPMYNRNANIPKQPFCKNKFRYDKEKDVYICPAGFELIYWSKGVYYGKMMRLYKTNKCHECQFRNKCTRNKGGKVIYRWEHEEILEDMRSRVEKEKDKVKMRPWLSEHPFGTIKRALNQGYMLMKGLVKVNGELALTMLVYDITRVINIVGVKKLIAHV